MIKCDKCGKVSHFHMKTIEVKYPVEYIKGSGLIFHETDFKSLCNKCYKKYCEELEAFKRSYFYYDENIPFDITYRLPENTLYEDD